MKNLESIFSITKIENCDKTSDLIKKIDKNAIYFSEKREKA